MSASKSTTDWWARLLSLASLGVAVASLAFACHTQRSAERAQGRQVLAEVWSLLGGGDGQVWISRLTTDPAAIAKALDLLDEAERFLPDDPNVERYRGLCEESRGDRDRAKAAYENAVRKDPHHVPSLTSLAWVQLQQGHPESAREILEDALRANPEDPQILYFLGLLHFTLGQEDRAEQAWIRSSELAPDFARVHQNLGTLYFFQNRFPEAERHFREAIRLDPELSGARTDLGILLMVQGRTTAAIENLQKAVTLDPANRRASQYLARLLADEGEVDRAREIAQGIGDLVTFTVSVPESGSPVGGEP